MTPANHDLRAFLHEVEKIGELRRIENIPWDKDIGGLVEMILERSANPAGHAVREDSRRAPGHGNPLQPDRHLAAVGHRHGHRPESRADRFHSSLAP